MLIISRCHTEEERAFYLQKTIDEHFSSRELDRQISSALYERTMLNKPKVSAVMRQTNPAAEQLFRDQYILEFIGTQGDHLENSFRLSLIQQMKKVILSQMHINILRILYEVFCIEIVVINCLVHTNLLLSYKLLQYKEAKFS